MEWDGCADLFSRCLAVNTRRLCRVRAQEAGGRRDGYLVITRSRVDSGGGEVEAAETGDRSRFYFLFLEFFFSSCGYY